MNLRFCAFVLALVLLICAQALPLAACADEAETVRYFYLNACESCHPEQDFEEEFQRITGKDLSDYSYTAYNVFMDAGRRACDEATAGLTEEEKKLPLVIVGNEIYAGSDAVSQGLAVQFGEAETDSDSVVYFRTTTACENCAEARETIDALPPIVPLTINGAPVSSQVGVVEINVAQEPEKAIALFERYAVPDDERVTPSVLFFWGGGRIFPAWRRSATTC